ncbi:Fur family transcriptional regulator [Aminipila luticellarii]|uniref:Transcriptional repressor n=1 Tax=Aminipila luticellarii TaxID=2507160 RepID=A0A410PU13_9FIRM|nr:Fur family transcriptional regulator [Aminipila luticellarii]QAT42461.1 transcriptional repressor [Aminipila luticellarii]
MEKNEKYEELLKESGLKNTKHRKTILEFLRSVNQPVSAEQIYCELKEKSISINLSTVYRTLETLSEKELILKHIVANESKALFEYNNRVHKHYLVCAGCKKIMAIEGCPLHEYEKLLEEKTGFIITGHKLDIYGLCPECQKKA